MHPDQDFDAKLNQYLQNRAHVITEVFAPSNPLSACPSTLTLTKNIPGCFVMLMGSSQTFGVPCSQYLSLFVPVVPFSFLASMQWLV